LEPGESKTLILKNKKEKNAALIIKIYNPTEVETTYDYCNVIGIHHSDWLMENSKEIIYFPGGVYIGAEVTKENLISIFGKPKNNENIEEKGFRYFFEKEILTKNNSENIIYIVEYNIEVEEGKITDLELTYNLNENK